MKIKKIFIFSLLTIQLLITFAPSTAIAYPIDSNDSKAASSIDPKVDDIYWQYKAIGNVMYRRLYNYSTNTPLSDWEIVP